MNGIILSLTRRALGDLAEGGQIILNARNPLRNGVQPLCCLLTCEHPTPAVLAQLYRGYGDKPGLGLTVGLPQRQALYDSGWAFVLPSDTWPFGDGSYRTEAPIGLCRAENIQELEQAMQQLGLQRPGLRVADKAVGPF